MFNFALGASRRVKEKRQEAYETLVSNCDAGLEVCQAELKRHIVKLTELGRRPEAPSPAVCDERRRVWVV